jgi:hypothetical protein
MFKYEDGNWTRFRQELDLTPDDEVDLHFGRRDRWANDYDEAMGEVARIVEESLTSAQDKDRQWLMFIHGWSTSHPGKKTARSVVRGFMRSPAATKFIVRQECIQHETVFVAKIKRRPQ